jgi:hypothetical protein
MIGGHPSDPLRRVRESTERCDLGQRGMGLRQSERLEVRDRLRRTDVAEVLVHGDGHEVVLVPCGPQFPPHEAGQLFRRVHGPEGEAAKPQVIESEDVALGAQIVIPGFGPVRHGSTPSCHCDWRRMAHVDRSLTVEGVAHRIDPGKRGLRTAAGWGEKAVMRSPG